MTHTMQSRSLPVVKEAESPNILFPSTGAVNADKPAAEDNLSLINSISDSLDTLCSRLNRLDCALNKRLTEIKSVSQKK